MESDYFKIWYDFILERNRLLSNISFKSQKEKFILVLEARINSLTEELLFLARNSRYTSSQILMRSIIETYIDLKCLVQDDSFIDVLMQSERESEIKYLENFSPNNRYYGFHSENDIQVRLRELYRENDKKKRMNIYQKFEKMDELGFYRTVYNYLCRHTHGNITALASKHFEDDKVKLSKLSITKFELIFILSSSINVAIASSLEVLKEFNFKEKDVNLFKSFINDVNKMTDQ
ncbi:hypothetical protein IB633_03730 [Francisella philomiragia]|uniref:Uncharacterized protein n=1 Tax=Francisella philomiragia subsp. philomiragia (strain ATCC 25017 / CCUG 19701 / FSC 153 / O\|nr:DUF5677 domain-containing protein [Francisella philomiragia]AJI47825.1 hypothetical protein BF30_493 [Francisella philomiragia]AJI48764.1 hypothetical protein KU46_1060 [Francisella philomiragia]MBK2020849.1 hypothetical protein [Francisella philomiragia]MBK2030199.1 hypothetical protein [Francisella philomiragia]MBK2264697.1 hypothetical protein [Francisella philomiragia]